MDRHWSLLLWRLKPLYMYYQRRIQEPKKGGFACRSQYRAFLRARYTTIVTYNCELEKGGSVEPSEPPLDPPLTIYHCCLSRKSNKHLFGTMVLLQLFQLLVCNFFRYMVKASYLIKKLYKEIKSCVYEEVGTDLQVLRHSPYS